MKTITFFSFKGGVGRSSLLANLGAYWADQGKQVAMMDLDLAAPGLSFLPQRGDHLEPEFSALGMSDVLSVFEQGFAETPKKLKLLPPSKLLREVLLPSESSGRLLLIEAGSSDWQRSSAVSEGILHNIAPVAADNAKSESKRQQAWRRLAQAIYEDLSAWRHPQSQQPLDLLLIDCRTGFAELLDFSLSYLTERQDDHLVLVSALNEQNRAGLRQSLRALQQQNRIPVDELAEQVSVVFSPVSISEDEASLQALELGTQVINDCLRLTHSGAKERQPHVFVLHYNQILASSEALLSVTHPHSLYAEEVSKIADWLVGKQQHPDRTLREISQRVGWEMDWNKSDDKNIPLVARKRPSLVDNWLVSKQQHPDRTLREISQRVGWEMEWDKSDDGEMPLAASKYYASKRPNLLSNLPAWYWPLEAPSNAERQQLLNKLMPTNPDIAIDRETLLNSLAFSPSLSTSEKERVLVAWPKINQTTVTGLLRIFEEERNRFSELSSLHTNWVFTRLHLLLPEWAALLLGDEQQGWRRYLYSPLQEGESLFAYAEHWGEYWGGLAGIALARFADKSASEQALQRVETTNSDPASVCLVAIYSGVRARTERSINWQPVIEWFTARLAQCQDSDSLCELGVAWNQEVQCYPESEQAYRKAIEIDPQHVNAWLGLGILLRNSLQRYNESEQAYLKALEIDPNNVKVWLNLGILLGNNLERHDEAEQAYHKAIEIDPKHANAWLGLALLLSGDLQRYDEAEQACRKALTIDPQNANAWSVLGLLLRYELQRYAEAEEAYRKALEINPNYVHNWLSLGNLLGDELQRYAEAEQSYRKALEIYPNNVSAWQYLGILLSNNLRRYSEAEEAYRKVLEIDPKHTGTWNDLGCLQEELGKCYEALRSWEQALSLNSQQPYALVNRAQLHFSLGAVAEELRADLASAFQSFKDSQNYASAIYAALAQNYSSEAQQLLDKLNSEGDRWTYFYQWLYALCTGDRVEAHSDTVTLEQLKSHSERKTMLERVYYLAGWRPEARERLQQAAQQLLQMDTSSLKGMPMLARREQLYTRFAAGGSNGGGDPRDLPLICNDASNNQQSNQT